MAEGVAVQGNTESAPETGVYSDAAPETPAQQTPAPVDAGVQAGVQTVADAVTDKPIEYDFKVPEGGSLDQEALDIFTPIMKELKASPEQAQKILDIQEVVEKKRTEAHETAVETARTEWVKEITNDPDLGGEKLKETLHVANQGLDKVATEGFKELLKQTGLGDHPEFIRVFHKIGAMNANDTAVFGGPSSGDSIGSMYPNSPELK